MELLYIKNHFNLTKKNLFSRYSKLWWIKHGVPGLNEGLSSNLVPEKSKLSKTYKRMYDVNGEAHFNKKMFGNRLKMVCHNELVSKRQSMEWKHTDSQVKKFRALWSVKKIMLTAFWDMKGLITNDFLEKGETVNNVSYCQFFWQNSPYLLNNSCILYPDHILQMEWNVLYTIYNRNNLK